MKVDLSKSNLKTNMIIQTKDWGIYAVNRFAMPYIDFSTNMFTSAQNPSEKDVIKGLNKYGKLWIMKTGDFFITKSSDEVPSHTWRESYEYPVAFINNVSVDVTVKDYFERVFNKDEIRKISCEPMAFYDWDRNKSGIYVIKEPKKTLIGSFGMYLDSKFK